MAASKPMYRNRPQLESGLRVASWTQAHSCRTVRTVIHFTLWVSVVSIGEDKIISLGRDGENRGPNLIGSKYNNLYIFT
jgi:hypothetical protein